MIPIRPWAINADHAVNEKIRQDIPRILRSQESSRMIVGLFVTDQVKPGMGSP